MMNKIITKKLWSAIFLFLVVISLVGVAFVVLSGLLDANRKSEEILSGYIGGNTDITVLKQDIVEAQEVQDTLRDWLLAPRETVNLVTYVESISDRVGLSPTIENLNTQKTITVGEIESAALELIVQLEGTFEETQQFLTLMENVPYQSHLEEVSIQKIGQSKWKILIQMIVYTNPQI